MIQTQKKYYREYMYCLYTGKQKILVENTFFSFGIVC